MRYVGFGQSAAIAMAAAALSAAFPVEIPAYRDPYEPARPPRISRVRRAKARSRRAWRGFTKTRKYAAGAYKGSKAAKRATKRGGNPARY